MSKVKAKKSNQKPIVRVLAILAVLALALSPFMMLINF